MKILKNTLIFCLGLFAIFNLAFFGFSSIEVYAEAKEGYFIIGCDTSSVLTCENGAKTDCRGLLSGRTNSIRSAFCTGGSGTKVFLIDPCTPDADGTCKDGNDTYVGCERYTNSRDFVGVCTSKATKTANGNQLITLSDSGYTCDITDNGKDATTQDLYGIKCKKDGKDVRSDFCVAFRTTEDSSSQLKLSCNPRYMVFGTKTTQENAPEGSGNASQDTLYWDVSGGYVFLTSKGSIYINKDIFGNGVDGVCQQARLVNIPVWISGVGDALAGNVYSCLSVINLGDFKEELVKKSGLEKKAPAINDIIANTTELKTAVVDSLKNCKDTKYSELKDDKQKAAAKKLKADATDATVFQLCDGGIVGIKDGNKITANINGVTQAYDATTGGIIKTTTTAKGTNAVADTSGKLLAALFGLISSILLWFVYLLGWIAVIVLYWLGLIILFFLRVNPAGKDFFEVAVAPWTLLIGVTNLMILGSFIYVGFGYILNLKNLKKNIQDFLQSVVIIAIALNFTIIGTATVINIFQGVGDVFVYSYAATKKGTEPEDINQVLIGSVINAIGRVSVLRCGKQVTTTSTDAKNKATSTECDITKDPLGQVSTLASTSFSPLTELFGGSDKMGKSTAALISESIFLVMVCVAIFVFWKAAYMATMRIVGLWLLMITSPIALAAYLSPIDALKPIGTQWVNKLTKWAPFYPIFVFALVLVNLLTDKFAIVSASDQLRLINEGAGSAGDLFNLSLKTILGGVISIGALYAVTNFMDKDFETFAKSAATTLGKYAKTGSSLYGAAGRAIGSGVNSTVGWGLRGTAGKFSAGLDKEIDANQKALKAAQRAGNTADIAKYEKMLKNQNKRKEFLNKAANRRYTLGIDKIANAVEFAPYVAEGLLKAPGHIAANYSLQAKARAAGFKAKSMKSLGYAVSSNKALFNAAKIAGYDLYADKDLGIKLGENPETIAKAIKEDQDNNLPNRFKARIEDAGAEAELKELGLAGQKLSQDIGEIAIQGVLDKVARGMQLNNEDKRIVEQAVESEDGNLINKLLSGGGSQTVRDMFPRFSANTQTKISNEMPYLLPTEEAQVGAIQNASEEQLEKMNLERLTPVQLDALQNRPLSDNVRNRIEATNTYATQDINTAKNRLKFDSDFAVSSADNATIKAGAEQLRRSGSSSEIDSVRRFTDALGAGVDINNEDVRKQIHEAHNEKEFGYKDFNELKNAKYSEEELQRLKDAGFATQLEIEIDESTEEGKQRAFQVYKRLAGVGMDANNTRQEINQKKYAERAKKLTKFKEKGNRNAKAHAAVNDALIGAYGEPTQGETEAQRKVRATRALEDKKVQGYMGAADLQEKMSRVVQGGGTFESQGLNNIGIDNDAFSNMNKDNRSKYATDIVDHYTEYVKHASHEFQDVTDANGNVTGKRRIVDPNNQQAVQARAKIVDTLAEAHMTARGIKPPAGSNEQQKQAFYEQQKNALRAEMEANLDKMDGYTTKKGADIANKYLSSDNASAAYGSARDGYDTKAQDIYNKTIEKGVRKFEGIETITGKTVNKTNTPSATPGVAPLPQQGAQNQRNQGQNPNPQNPTNPAPNPNPGPQNPTNPGPNPNPPTP